MHVALWLDAAKDDHCGFLGDVGLSQSTTDKKFRVALAPIALKADVRWSDSGR
jgi:hypothetical protein